MSIEAMHEDVPKKVKESFEELEKGVRWALTIPRLSDAEKDDLPIPSRADMKTLRRLIFDRLPEARPVRQRVGLAAGAGWLGAALVPVARSGFDERQGNEARRLCAQKLQQAIDGIVSGVRCLLMFGQHLESWSMHRCAFTSALTLLADRHGISCREGLISDKLQALLTDLATLCDYQIPIPGKLDRRVKDPASRFDLAIYAALRKTLSQSETARLIADCRVAVGLPKASPGAIRQRIRNASL